MKKQIINGLVTVLIILATLEIIPFLAGKVFIHDGYSRREIKRELLVESVTNQDSTIQLANDDGGYLGEHLLHPYLGYVSVPRSGYNELGFFGPNPILKKGDDVVNICITGGSVAKQLYQVAADRIKNNLEKDLAFSGKKVNIISLALGGFKQPQQLLSVNYMMALGAEYDIVINLDGFNEIVLPLSDNLPFKVFPSYPRHWNIYSRKKLDQRVILQMGKQAELHEKRESSRRRLANSIFRQSNFVLFLWKISDQQKNNKILQVEAELRRNIENKESDYQSTGPAYDVPDTITFLKDQVDFWVNTSKQLSALTKDGNFRYYHFLQPNQYDEGSKVLTEEELNIAFEAGPFAYKAAAQKGYPLLRTGGEKLLNDGVNYTDLSGIFKNERRSVYSDKCCHFNELGYFTIADAITDKILAKY
ncbi:MAG TPA: hypothetical protein P5514_11155 [Bacteroidales bacterium]|nr:hypothetical protein [Bacteroidales bacterium]HRX97495.1 hypothetical protein [Bacteroidales bacterium]